MDRCACFCVSLAFVFCIILDCQMTKTIRKLEKETTMWRTRWENSNRSLLEMVEEVSLSLCFLVSLSCSFPAEDLLSWFFFFSFFHSLLPWMWHIDCFNVWPVIILSVVCMVLFLSIDDLDHVLW